MSRFEEREWVNFENYGQKLFGVLHRPLNGKEKLPGVIIYHGFAGNKIGHKRLYVATAEQLVGAGFAVLRFDFRGCGDSEGNFAETTIETLVDDGMLALDWFEKAPRIDKDRIAIIGSSLGGAISVLAAKKHKNIKCITMWSAIANGRQWQEEWEKQFPGEQPFDNMDYQGTITSKAFVQQLFSLKADEDSDTLQHIPILNLHGEKDLIVPVHHSDAYKKHRQKAPNTRFVRLPNSDHVYTDMPERQKMIDETCSWFQKNL